MRKLRFGLLGGDQRQLALAAALREDGHTVDTYALGEAEEPNLDALAEADCAVLPLPVTVDGILLNTPLSPWTLTVETVLDALRPGQLVCGGMIEPAFEKSATARGLTLADYLAREELAVRNTVPGALAVEQRVRTGGDDPSSPPV